MTNTFLDKVYDLDGADDTRDLYDDWAKSYEAEVAEHGYATPARCAKALAAHSADIGKPILDFACGTGLSGLALKTAGFAIIDGIDLSQGMLNKAREKNVYRTLTVVEADMPLQHAPGDYAAITAIGAIGTGAAPISVFDTLMAGLAKGGLVALSFNDHALAEPQYEAKLNEWIDSGAASLLFKEYGPHLPGLGMKSNVYVLAKT